MIQARPGSLSRVCCGPAQTLLLEPGSWGWGLWLISPLYEEMTSLKLKLWNRNKELEEADNRLSVSVYALSCGLLDAHTVRSDPRVILEHNVSIRQFPKHTKFSGHGPSVPWIFYRWLHPAESFRNSTDPSSRVSLGRTRTDVAAAVLSILLLFC